MNGIEDLLPNTPLVIGIKTLLHYLLFKITTQNANKTGSKLSLLEKLNNWGYSTQNTAIRKIERFAYRVNWIL